jgi:hypothetical protein
MKSNVAGVKGFQFNAYIKDCGSVLIGHPRDHGKNNINSRMSFSQPWKLDTSMSAKGSISVELLEFGLTI